MQVKTVGWFSMNNSLFTVGLVMVLCFTYMVWSILHTVKRTPALKALPLLLIILATLFCGIGFWRAATFYEDNQFLDSIYHDKESRYLANRLGNASFSIKEYLHPGNRAYQLVNALFYKYLHLPVGAIILFNSTLAYLGLLKLAELLCITSGVRRAPAWMLFILIIPSCTFWTITNLKEGAMLWAACSLLSTMVVKSRSTLSKITKPVVIAAFVLVVLRPHMALGWLGAIAIADAWATKSRKTVLIVAPFAILAYFAIQLIVPETSSAAGLLETSHRLSERASEYGATMGRSGISERPILFFTGISFLLLRPLPTEVHSFSAFVAGLEIWVITLAIAIGWIRSRCRVQMLRHPIVLASLLAILLLAIPFSFMYNLGLVARQRVIAMPALVVLAALPALSHRPLHKSRVRRFGAGAAKLRAAAADSS